MSASVASSVWWGLARSRSLSLALASAARRCNGIQQQHARVACRYCESQSVIKGKDQLVARTAAAMYRQRVISEILMFLSLNGAHHTGSARGAFLVHVYKYTWHGRGRCVRQPR
jgi:DNA-directed RNA polymerase subunit RPC12/RpoP